MKKKKVCSKCTETKAETDFYFRKDSNTYRNECKACVVSNRRIYRQTDHQKSWDREYKKSRRKCPIKGNKLREHERTTYKARWNAKGAKRRAKKLKATPRWLSDFDFDYIKHIYKQAEFLGMHVDHIIPLISKEVSGLHLPWNLQLLSKEDNLVKSNKFDGTHDNEGWRE